MLQIGQFNRLQVRENSAAGVCLDGRPHGEIRLLSSEVTRCKVGELLEVFVYPNSDGTLVATTRRPIATVGQFACLKVTSLQNVGAFLNWGLPKELFLPFREQTRDLMEGDEVCVFIYLDNSNRISASMRIDKYIDKTPHDYFEGEKVDLFITYPTELGYKAIVNDRHIGILYQSEIFQPLRSGQHLTGYIKRLRPDGKLDLSLYKSGYKECESIADKILTLLDKRGGHLPVGDKSSAETIYELFGVSKKKFKMALGGLYKKNLITFDSSEQGTRLNRSSRNTPLP